MKPRRTPMWLILLLVALSCESHLVTAATVGSKATDPGECTEYGCNTFRRDGIMGSPLDTETINKIGNENKYGAVIVPVTCFISFYLLQQAWAQAKDDYYTKECTEGHDSKGLNAGIYQGGGKWEGLEAKSMYWNSNFERIYPEIKVYSRLIGARDKQNNTIMKLYHFAKGDEGFIGLMMHDAVILEKEAVNDGDILVAIDCKPLNDDKPENTAAIQGIQSYVDKLGNRDQGTARQNPMSFTFLRLAEGYNWCDSDPREGMFGDHLLLKEGECENSDATDLRRFLQTMKTEMISDAAFKADEVEGGGRDVLHVRVKKHTFFWHIKVIIMILSCIAFGIVPPYVFIIAWQNPVFYSESTPELPGGYILQMLSGPLLLVSLVLVDNMLDRIMWSKLKNHASHLHQTIFIAAITGVTIGLPLRLFILSKRFNQWNHIYALHLTELVLTWISHIMEMLFMTNSVIVYLQHAYGIHVPFIFGGEAADVILSLGGCAMAVADMINAVRDAHGMGDQCDINYLHELVMTASIQQQFQNPKFSLECSEWPAADTDGTWGWDNMTPAGKSQRMDVSDQTVCTIYCTNGFGTHGTMTKCTPAGLVGGQWSFAYQPILQKKLCYTKATNLGSATGGELPPGEAFAPYTKGSEPYNLNYTYNDLSRSTTSAATQQLAAAVPEAREDATTTTTAAPAVVSAGEIDNRAHGASEAKTLSTSNA